MTTAWSRERRERAWGPPGHPLRPPGAHPKLPAGSTLAPQQLLLAVRSSPASSQPRMLLAAASQPLARPQQDGSARPPCARCISKASRARNPAHQGSSSAGLWTSVVTRPATLRPRQALFSPCFANDLSLAAGEGAVLVMSWELSPAEFGAPRTGPALLLLLRRRRRTAAVTRGESAALLHSAGVIATGRPGAGF